MSFRSNDMSFWKKDMFVKNVTARGYVFGSKMDMSFSRHVEICPKMDMSFSGYVSTFSLFRDISRKCGLEDMICLQKDMSFSNILAG